MRRGAFALAAVLVAAVGAREAASQGVAQRINVVRDGVVLMTFAARPGVCGSANGSMWTRDSWSGTGGYDQRRLCVPGPVRVSLGRADNSTVSVRVHVGGAWRPDPSETDLGTVPAAEAARYLITLAREIGGHSGNDAVSAAAFADSTNIGPDLVALARDSNAPLDARRQALYWAGQTEIPTRELASLYDRLEPFALREHFTFVISQRRDDAAVDKLMDIARRDADRELRKRAMFWLGQTNDPRALKFLRDIVTR
jgi:hypothetical protein